MLIPQSQTYWDKKAQYLLNPYKYTGFIPCSHFPSMSAALSIEDPYFSLSSNSFPVYCWLLKIRKLSPICFPITENVF
jgi:hypothetical protein